MFLVPAQKRPARSTLPSLKRLPGMPASGMRNRCHGAIGRVEKYETDPRAGNQPAAPAQPDAAGDLRHRPARNRASRRLEPLDNLSFHIDPVQRLLSDTPHRTLTDEVGGGDEYADIRRGCGQLSTTLSTLRSFLSVG